MTPTKNRILSLFAAALVTGFLGTAHATSGLLSRFNSTYGTAGTVLDTCSTCHSNTPSLNPYGSALSGAGDNFAAIENLDSDGDGFTNIQEIKALTFPGDPSSHPAGTPPPPDTMPPSVTAFTIPATSASCSIAITSFMATDNVRVTGYLVTPSATAPAATAAGWAASAPTSFSVSTAGSVTLWAWAKDAAGNVSAGMSATTNVTAASCTGGGGGGGTDTIPPVITAFKLPATTSGRTIHITSFTATDDVAVTGYIVSASSRKPMANSSRWHAHAPTSFAFRGEASGRVTLHAWAKDAAGNISAPAEASTVVSLSGGGDDGDGDDSGGSTGETGDDSGSTGSGSGSGGEDDAAISPRSVGAGASQASPGSGAVSQMDVWVSRWFGVSIQNPSGLGSTTTGYLKFQSWNEDDGIMQATLFTQNSATGAWQSADLEFAVTGSPMHFLASFEHAGEFSFAASVIGTKQGSQLQSANLQAVGISQSQHLAALNGSSGNGPIRVSGQLLSENQVPQQILH